MNKKAWQISKNQKTLLDSLFKEIDDKNIKNILDIGSGRTSLSYLTDKYKNVVIDAVVYPGDERKIVPILECVKSKNYKIIESDIKNLKNKKFDIILAHLFLGEAEKFGNNKFQKIIELLFLFKTKYLILVNREDDYINYHLLLKHISKKGKIIKIFNQSTEGGHECLGLTIHFS